MTRIFLLFVSLVFAAVGAVSETRAPASRQSSLAPLLASANEPVLAAGAATQKETYRLIWTRSFNLPVVLRAEIDGNSGKLFVKVLEPTPDSKGLKLKRAETRTLRPQDVTRLRWLFNHVDFQPRPDEIPGLDGSTWTVEGLVDGKFRTAYAWSPHGGPLYDFGFFMIEQAIGGDLVPIY